MTSRFHVSRARVLLARCSDLEVDVRASVPDIASRLWVRAVLHEVAGLTHSLVVGRC